ncbi:hypothetical protein [Hymenobacter coccineus]|uniref:Uncharacterized protein n=1 Tax=Hymenobacter coccineus TaxID=1908235 RepID=A0A1G1THC8_9BACT|nr:hypothetical protein [Hymenobacter coccineus]OGX90267.1 hypothetical protein BEN49_23310 [Hymenobacter coccineus]
MPESYYARLSALATAPAATPADQLPKLRQLLEQVLRDECRRREAPFADLSQAIGLVAYDHRLPPLLRRQLQNLRLTATWYCTKATPGTPAEAAAGFGALARLVEHLTGEVYDGAPCRPVACRVLTSKAMTAPNPWRCSPWPPRLPGGCKCCTPTWPPASSPPK